MPERALSLLEEARGAERELLSPALYNAALHAVARSRRSAPRAGLAPRGVGWRRDVVARQAHDLLQQMRTDGFAPDARSYQAVLLACSQGTLNSSDITFRTEAAVCVVMAAKGYPGDYEKGSVIGGLDKAGSVEGVQIFHAGTKAEGGKILANGGRVLGVTAIGATIAQAQARAYEAVDRIEWPEGFCRRDIAWQALKAAS
jgi:hypothetical protein